MAEFGRSKKSYKKFIYKKNSPADWKRRLLVSVILTLTIFMFWTIFLSPWMMVKNIEIKGNKTIDQGKIEDLVKENIHGNYFYLIPKAKIFLVKPGLLSNALKDKFPLLLQTNMRRIFPDKISLEIVERSPAGIWCKKTEGDNNYLSGYEGLTVRLKESRNYGIVSCYDYDTQGVIFQQAPHTSGSLITKVYNHSSQANSYALGSKAMESGLIQFVTKANSALNNELELKAEQVILGTKNEGVVFYFTDGWFLILNQDADLSYQLTVLKNALNQSIKDQRSNLAYIDLRVQNRAYYKYK